MKNRPTEDINLFTFIVVVVFRSTFAVAVGFVVVHLHFRQMRKKIFFLAKNEKFLSEKRLLNSSGNKNSQVLDIGWIGHKKKSSRMSKSFKFCEKILSIKS